MDFFKKIFGWIKEHKGKTAIMFMSVISMIFMFIFINNFDPSSLMTAMNETNDDELYTVTNKDIDKIINKKGVIESIDKYDITSLVEGEIKEDYFQEGDNVNAGDLLYLIKSDDLDSSIQSAKLDIQKAEFIYNESVKKCNDLSVKAGENGTITQLLVEKGDIISEGDKIAEVIDNGKMVLKINFLKQDAEKIHIGDVANIIMSTNGVSLSGTVSYISTGSIDNSFGIPVTPIEIVVNNPAAIKVGDKALANVLDYSCNSQGEFFSFSKTTVYSSASGTVKSINFKIGDIVSKNNVILNIDNPEITTQKEQNLLSLNSAKITYENYIKQLENYKIKAPISGKIVQKNIKAGENTNTVIESPLAVIENTSGLVFNIEVDETDILSLEEGQNVSVEADAIRNVTYEGVIENISTVANSNNGISTYPVRITVLDSEDTKLIPGMNVTAKIEIDSRKNALVIPAKAVKRGNKILVVKEKKETKKGKFEYTTKEVVLELGLSNGSYVEVISGLNKGDEILIKNN